MFDIKYLEHNTINNTTKMQLTVMNMLTVQSIQFSTSWNQLFLQNQWEFQWWQMRLKFIHFQSQKKVLLADFHGVFRFYLLTFHIFLIVQFSKGRQPQISYTFYPEEVSQFVPQQAADELFFKINKLLKVKNWT